MQYDEGRSKDVLRREQVGRLAPVFGRMRVRRHCPFCGWCLEDTGPTIDTGSVRYPVDANRIYEAYLAAVEAKLQAHLDTHVDEMVATARPPG